MVGGASLVNGLDFYSCWIVDDLFSILQRGLMSFCFLMLG